MGAKSFTELRVWEATMDATEDIYKMTRPFPAEETFGIVAQIRRAVVSIGCNISEGFGRRAPRDKANFYTIAFGSAEEVKHLLLVSRRLKYVADVDALVLRMESISKMLRRLTDCVLGDASAGRGLS